MTACPLASHKLRMLLEWWLHSRGERTMPRRSDLDPSAFPSLLPHVWLLDYVVEQSDYRYRLAGEHINEIFGYSLRGKWISDVMGAEKRDIVRKRFDHVRQGPGACHACGSVYLRVERYRSGERLILPLADESGTPAHIIGATIYHYDEHDARAPNSKQQSTMQETLLSLNEIAAWVPNPSPG